MSGAAALLVEHCCVLRGTPGDFRVAGEIVYRRIVRQPVPFHARRERLGQVDRIGDGVIEYQLRAVFAERVPTAENIALAW